MTEIIKFDRIVSVNSQVQGHSAQNVLDGEISPSKNWMCDPGTEKAVIILQLERAAVLTSIHVGNAHSAFVEVLVGRAADSADQFECFVPMSSFMNPHESKTGTNPNRTRFFTKADFNEATASKFWDRIKVVCSQPFNKYVSYGLCFLEVHGEKEAKKVEAAAKSDDGDQIQIGSFFKKKRSSAGDKALTVSEQMKEAEKEASLAKRSPIRTAKIPERISWEKKAKPNEEERKKSESRTPSRPKEEDKTRSKRKEEVKEKEKTVRTRKDGKSGNDSAVRRKREGKRKRPRKPFEKLMEDVVLVISGFKNPLRGDIRSKALEMGAKYMADWESHCTHLVSAFENTPKCQKVKGKGKIVKKDWVEKCHEDRKRYPWRRFALDKMDLKKPESEEEVEAGEESESEEKVGSSSAGRRTSEVEEVARSSSPKAKSGDDDYEAATDDDDDDEDKRKAVDTTDYPMPYLPDIFSLKTFFVDPSLECKAALERYIVAYNGVLTETFSENVEFYVTDKGGPPVELFRKKAPNLIAIKPSWIWEINSKQKCIPTTPHLVK